jgi:hypothetical protein
MTSPRIYTYKVTFEEVPHWYWGVHKENRLNDGYMGSPSTHRWMWEFYTPKIQILEVFPFTEGGWKEAILVEKRLIRPDLNIPLCLNERCNLINSVDSARKGGEKCKEKGVGIFGRTLEEHTESSKRGGKKGGKVMGKKAVEMKLGIHSPEHKYAGVEVNRTQGTSFWDPEVREKSYEKTRKPVELTCLKTGEILNFRSASESARLLNLNRGNLCAVCRGVKPNVGGFSARYVDQNQ